jgi:hypothetical protein
MSHIAQQRLLFVVAAAFGLVVSLSIFSRLYAGIPDAAASATMIATIDAGPVTAAPIVPAAPVAVAPPVLPDPIDRPVEFVEQLEPAREYGGVHVLVLLVVAALARSLAKRIAPVEGSPPPTGWRGKSIMVLSTVAVVVGSLLDLLLGSLTGVGFGIVGTAGALALRDPRNKAPVKAARSPVPPLVAGLLVIAVLLSTSCATVRRSGAAGAEAGLDCSAPALRATAGEAAVLAKAFVLSKISGTGEVDTDALRAAARSLKSEAMRCGLVAAIAAVADAMEPPQPSVKLLQAQPASVDLRALARDIATVEWGIVGPVIVEGGEI